MAHLDVKYVKALLEDDGKVINEIFSSFFNKVKNHVIRHQGTVDDAKDLFNESLVAVYVKATREGAEFLNVPFEAYLLEVSKRQWNTVLRNRSRLKIMVENLGDGVVEGGTQLYTSVGLITETSNTPEDEILMLEKEQDRNRIFDKALSNLPEYCQKLVAMAVKFGLNNQQIAEKTQQSLKGVTNRKSECLQRLRDAIQKDLRK